MELGVCVAGAGEGQGGASTLNGGRVGACAITIEGGLKDEHLHMSVANFL